MSYTKAIRAFPMILLLCIALQGSQLLGQEVYSRDSVKFSVLITPPAGTIDTLKSEAMHTLYEILKTRGAVDTRTPNWLFLVETKEIPDVNRDIVVVSISTLRVLPKEAIEAGKHEEVFYANLSAEKKAAMPAEGRWVREMVTEEMLRQYGIPVDADILVVRRGQLRQELGKFVDEFYSRLARREY